MNLRELFLTKNDCYNSGQRITPKGIMVHSTGANNPWLKRYVGPDDGLLGKNQYGNHWNQPKPSGREVCVHAFIGKLADGTVATYQTLPWEHRGWHAGGKANDTHIGFEICEDGLTDGNYFAAIYKEAVELCAHLCKQYGLTEKDIICHSEGSKLGIASNSSDVMHWFPRHGKSMDDFRAAVALELNPHVPIAPEAETQGARYFERFEGSTVSIVAALKAIGENSAYSYRAEIAKLNGIEGYKGTAAQNTLMLTLLKQGKLIKEKDTAPAPAPIPVPSAPAITYFPAYTGGGVSIVNALKAVGADSSFTYRQKIAEANGIEKYTGTAAQNRELLNVLKQGKLIKI